ncbi:MAG TPA: rhomboid family intramembrane serine protease [Candidatus Methylomirabilis sp.]|jgi:membrane associated rhomboid family serine protease
MNWDRLQWKWRLFKQRLAQAGEELTPRARSGASHLKTCRECRALVARSARTCPECGAHLGWFVRRGHRAGAGLFEQAPATGTLLVAIFGLYLVTWIASGLSPVGVSSRVLYRLGAYNSFVFQSGQYWRLLTGVFLHGGIAHILFNAAALYQLGQEVESVYGWGRTLTLFTASGVAGSTASVLFGSFSVVGIGASGAIFGLIGVVGVFGYRRGGSYGRAVTRIAVQWAIFGLAFGFLGPLFGFGRIDNTAHMGGLVAGALLAFFVPPERQRVSPFWNAAGILAAALVPVAFALAFLRG